MKTLYVSDLDGTLLHSDATMSDNSILWINDLIDRGLLFTYATARPFTSASSVTKGLIVSLPIITYNGAFLVDPSGRTIFSCLFCDMEKKHIAGIIEKHRISPLVYTYSCGAEKVSYTQNRLSKGIQKYLSLRRGDKRMNPLPDTEDPYSGDVFYFTCIADIEDLLPMYEALRCDTDAFHCVLQPESYTGEYWLEIMPKEANKANAIQRLKAMVGCDRVISFGDALNDIPMFTICDECYAVQNAVQELKSIATAVIESNDEDGVAKWLSAHHRIGCHEEGE